MRLHSSTLLTLALALALSFCASGPVLAGEQVFLRDDFADLTRWMPYSFKNIERHSSYAVELLDSGFALRTESDASASGLTLTRAWDIREYPLLRFRWKVENVYAKGDAATKNGDDFPLRIYVVFAWDEGAMTLGDRFTAGLARMFSKADGQLPHSSLNYVWANRPHEKQFIPSAYTGRSMLIPLQSGCDACGQWITEERDLLKDYRQAFDDEPPHSATLAVMNDSDNTGEASRAWLDFIQIYRTTPPAKAP